MASSTREVHGRSIAMNAVLQSLTLVDLSGHAVLLAIALALVASLITTAWLHLRYRRLSGDVRDAVPNQAFAEPVLNRILSDAEAQARGHGGEINAQAVVEHNFQTELGSLLVGERFVRAAPGLVIILGLVGTFYGLTLSIGKLATLVSAEGSGVAEMTNALTSGLTEALSGMSVAFTTSLAGIVAAIVLTLFGIFSSVTDRRNAVIVQIENHLEKVVAPQFGSGWEVTPEPTTSPIAHQEARLQHVVHEFGAAIARLEGSVGRFDSSLQGFAERTRDFQEFNLHLKDNVQRMSLGFADFSETLKTQTRNLTGRTGR